MTAPATASVGEWIAWAGGKCPVYANMLVDVRHLDGDESLAARAGDLIVEGVGGFDWWKHEDADCGPDGFVVAYRPPTAARAEVL